MNILTTRCDDSGLCQVADESQATIGPKRRYMRSRTSAVLVDIAPVAVGHSLVVPAAHVTATIALEPADFSDAWTLAEQARHRITAIDAGQLVVLLEHGLAPEYKGPSCVRHTHIHVCPIDSRTRSWADLENTLDKYLIDVKAATSLQEAVNSARLMDSYVIGSLGPWWFTGRPQPKLRQVTRAILCSLSTEPPSDPDWILSALGEKYRASMDLLADLWPSTVGTSAKLTASYLPSAACERGLR